MGKKENDARYYQRHHDELLAKQNAYAARHRDTEASRSSLSYYQNKEHYLEWAKEYRQRNKGAIQARVRKNYIRLKMEVLGHYSKVSIPMCVRCQEVDIRCLTIDHVDGGGKQRRQVEGIGAALYYWLKRNKYPTGYQTLCQNCQQRKRWENKESGFYYSKKRDTSAYLRRK